MADPLLLEVDNLTVTFPDRMGTPFDAVAGISLGLGADSAFGIVGESGAGKSVLLRTIAGLYPPARGDVRIHGISVARARGAELRALRRKVQIVLQDPYTSLPPGRTVTDILTEPLVIHRIGTGPEQRRKAAETLESVGLPAAFLTRVPASSRRV